MTIDPAAIRTIVAAEIADRHIPAAAVQWNVGGQELTIVVGTTTATSKKPVVAADRFGWRSITKSLVGTVVLQLVDEKKVELDAPISEYLSGVPNGTKVTVRQLLAMRSGIGNYTISKDFGAALGQDPGRAWTDQELLAFGYKLPQTFAPGTSYEYSNTNTILLGVLIEKVTGKPWDAEVKTRISDKLGLTSLVYPGSKPLAAPLAPANLIENGKAEESPFISFSGLSAAGGSGGTVTDLARWGKALAGGELLSADLQAERFENPSDVKKLDPTSPVYDGYGLAIGEEDGWWGHTGFALGYAGIVMSDPKSLDTVAILVNGTETDGEVPAEVLAVLRDRLLP